jgi:hypothetical protein
MGGARAAVVAKEFDVVVEGRLHRFLAVVVEDAEAAAVQK